MLDGCKAELERKDKKHQLPVKATLVQLQQEPLQADSRAKLMHFPVQHEGDNLYFTNSSEPLWASLSVAM